MSEPVTCRFRQAKNQSLVVSNRDWLFKLLIKFLYGQVSSHRLYQKIKSMSYFFRSEQVKIAFLGKIRARKLNILTLKDVDLVDYPLQLMPLGATPYFQKVICYINIRFFSIIVVLEKTYQFFVERAVFDFRHFEVTNGPFYAFTNGHFIFTAKIDGYAGI